MRGADKEVWKRIQGYERLYEISNKGRVRSRIVKRWSKKRNRKRTRKLITPIITANRAKVGLYNEKGERKWHQLKDLVATHWLRPRIPGAKIRLIDKSHPEDCSISNLRYLHINTKQSQKLNEEELTHITEILKENDFGKTKRGLVAQLARMFEVSKDTVRIIANNEQEKHLQDRSSNKKDDHV